MEKINKIPTKNLKLKTEKELWAHLIAALFATIDHRSNIKFNFSFDYEYICELSDELKNRDALDVNTTVEQIFQKHNETWSNVVREYNFLCHLEIYDDNRHITLVESLGRPRNQSIISMSLNCLYLNYSDIPDMENPYFSWLDTYGVDYSKSYIVTYLDGQYTNFTPVEVTLCGFSNLMQCALTSMQSDITSQLKVGKADINKLQSYFLSFDKNKKLINLLLNISTYQPDVWIKKHRFDPKSSNKRGPILLTAADAIEFFANQHINEHKMYFPKIEGKTDILVKVINSILSPCYTVRDKFLLQSEIKNPDSTIPRESFKL